MRATQTDPYSLDYAAIYDGIYPTPDYGHEFITKRLGPATRVLDLGCGTGRHAVGLPYQIVGIDRSQAMLDIAKEKLPEHTWIKGNIVDFDVAGLFDGAYMLSDILSYHTTTASVIHALANIGVHLKKGSTLLFDCWYGAAVLTKGPRTSQKAFGATTRLAHSIVDYANNVCKVHYDFKRGDDHWSEEHDLRYFFIPELRWFLQLAGFTDINITGKSGAPPFLSDWHIVVTATKA
jgi:SAM-dependent methyltransferase